MKKAAYLFALFFSQYVLFAKEPQFLKTGLQPLAIHHVSDTVHVFCNGNDIDYDGICEPGDGEKPAMWLTYNANTYELLNYKIMDGYFDIPFRPGLSSTRLYLPRRNTIEMYELSSQTLIDSSLFTLPNPSSNITAIHVVTTKVSGREVDMALALSHKTSFTEQGYMSLYSLITRQPLFQTQVGINPQMIRSYYNLQSQLEFAILCEGTFGGKNSSLQIVNISDTTKAMIYGLGDTGNYFLIQDQLALTVMNGSHEIIPVNLATKTTLPAISVGTSGYDGPREIIVDSLKSLVYVSTYASDVRIGSFLDGSVIGTLNPNGKPEGMALINNSLLVCNAFKSGDYAPDTTIAIFPLDESTSVHADLNHRTGEAISINGNIYRFDPDTHGEQVQYNVINTKGMTVLRGSVDSNTPQISFEGLPIGLYVVTIEAPGYSFSKLVLFRP